MISQKKTGSFYTPEVISTFIVNQLFRGFEASSKINVLEPSAGDGSFLKAVSKNIDRLKNAKLKITAVEKISSELAKARKKLLEDKVQKHSFRFIVNDFLNFNPNPESRYSIILGNPPYIKKSLLSSKQKQKCLIIDQQWQIGSTTVPNIWPYFLLKCCRLLKKEGRIGFVLPAEMLQVNFAKPIRDKLLEFFDRIEIFTFDDLLFECKGQDTVLFFGYKQHDNSGQFYSHISNLNQLSDLSFILSPNIVLNETSTKWTHHSLSGDELNYIFSLKSKVPSVDAFCDSKPGIVTAANQFFLIDRNTENTFNLTKFLKPIVEKAYHINGNVVFNQSLLMKLEIAGKRTKLLSLNDDNVDNLPIGLKKYLQIGIDKGIPNGYKCSKRKNWFVVPNVTNAPDAFIFRRIHQFPKLIRNDAKALVTDSAYQIEMRQLFAVDRLIYSFYNSLTLLFSEIEGRYFGGGLLELTPKEFKRLPLPYYSKDFSFADFKKSFSRKATIDEVLVENDAIILGAGLGLTLEDLEKIKLIHAKLLSKRLRLV